MRAACARTEKKALILKSAIRLIGLGGLLSDSAYVGPPYQATAYFIPSFLKSKHIDISSIIYSSIFDVASIYDFSQNRVSAYQLSF
jgi:hypothetical protein